MKFMQLNSDKAFPASDVPALTRSRLAVSAREFVSNYAAAMVLLSGGCLFYLYHPHFRKFFSGHYKFYSLTITGKEILLGALVLYAICLVPFYLTLPRGYIPKSRLVWRGLFHLRSGPLLPAEKTAVLATLVKFFFLPLMLVWLVEHVSILIRQWHLFFDSGTFLPNGYWLFFQVILLVDVLFFCMGYTLEHPKLGNEIRSVEPTLLGWLVALVCYPPFNGMMNQVLGWHSSDYPQFQTVIAQYIGGIAMLVFLAIYAWGSAALNLKASNLTHRGIVSTGPYRWVRHPAYTAKNIAWWIGAIPILATEWQRGYSGFAFALLGTMGWTFIYYLRALTEERHLLRDPRYAGYCRSVPYRFIPGVL